MCQTKLIKQWNTICFVWLKICWTIITPAILIALSIFSWVQTSRITIGDYVFPYWTEVVGNIISASSLLGVVGWIFYEIFIKNVIYNLIISIY